MENTNQRPTVTRPWGDACVGTDTLVRPSRAKLGSRSSADAPEPPHPVTEVSEVTLPSPRPSPKLLLMQFSRAHLAIALGSAGLLVLVFLGYLYWLSNQPPVLSRSEERDPLTQMPIGITMNPFRDRTIERTANRFISEMRDGNCRKLLAQWEKDYRKKRADFLCNSEAQHPLISWNLVEWEDAPPLVIQQPQPGRNLQGSLLSDRRKERFRLDGYEVRFFLLRQSA